VALKLKGIKFKVYQLDVYHYRIELLESPPSIYVCAVLYAPLGELYVPEEISNQQLKAILKFSEDKLGKVQRIIRC
jgi:hypothetical protein